MRKEFGTLRQNTVMQIFKASLSRSGITRAEIADEADVSVMTVGKAVDALISLDVLCQSHCSDQSPGRPARALYPSRHKWIAVYEISDALFSFYMLDLSLKIIDSFEYEPVSTAFPDDEVKYFAHLARIFAASRRKSPECIACGILIPCGYDSDEDRLITENIFLSRIRPSKLFDGYTFSKVPCVGNMHIFNAARLSSVLHDGVFAAVFYLDRGNIKSTVMTRNAYRADSTRLYDAGAFRIPGEKKLDELSRSEESIEDFCFSFTELVMTAVFAMGVNTIILCGTMYGDMNRLSNIIGDMVYRRCADEGILPPEIMCGSVGRESAVGISGEMRDKWFLEEMLNTY